MTFDKALHTKPVQLPGIKKLSVPENINKNCDHMGCIDFFDGKIYSPWEFETKGGDPTNPAIVEYSTSFAELGYGFLSDQYLNDGAPWCAALDNTIYITKYSNPDKIITFDIDKILNNHKTLDNKCPEKSIVDIKYSDNIKYRMSSIQAGKIHNGRLYLLDNSNQHISGDDPRWNLKIYIIDIVTGTVNDNIYAFYPEHEHGNEAEGLCFCKSIDGNKDELLITITDTFSIPKIAISRFEVP